MKSSQQILVIGASGKTGSRVVQGLKTLGVNVKGASRSGEVKFDWNDINTWKAALTGVDKVYLTYYPDLAVPQAPDDIARFCDLAQSSGVKHVTLLSGRGERAAQVCENIIKHYDFTWTVVRAAWFNQNFSEGLFRQFVVNGLMALPVGDVTEPFVDVDDIAEVVIASLLEDKHQGQLYEVTGPELVSFKQLADKFSRLSGLQVKFEPVAMAEFQDQMRNIGASESEIAMLTYLFSEVLDGRNAFICDGVERALGRPPRSFEQYISGALMTFREEV